MADTKISALPSATTPLAGTEVVPLVQSSTTKNVSVANLTAGRNVSCADLTTTGNVILGDASTDSVRVNGYMGVGGAGLSQVGLQVTRTTTGSVNQYGIQSNPTFDSGATTSGSAFDSYPQTSAASYTLTNLYGYRARSGAKGAGSTITNLHGIKIDNLTIGTNNYGITSEVSSGANKWNLYASGTANNYMAGNLQFASGKGIDFSATASGILWNTGTGSPEGVVTASVGSLYTRSDGGAGTTLYVKESGTGNTGWVAK